MASATTLSTGDIDFLRQQADHQAGPFPDPSRVASVCRWWKFELREWATSIVGHPVNHPRTLSWRDVYLLELAHSAEPTPPPAPGITATRDAYRAADAAAAAERVASRAAKQLAWAELYTALPVLVVVAHNFTSHRHVGHFEQGADHIITLEPIARGRLHRAARDPLCWRPSRADALAHFPELNDPGRLLPTCRECIGKAYRLADRQPDRVLLPAAIRR